MRAVLELIQEPLRPSKATVPVIFIHDGGGTIFQYFMLGSLNVTLHGIANPYFNSDESPPGGIPQLAKEYIEAIRAKIKSGPLIVGGWSLGGLIALEISRLLQTDTNLSVVGLLMIDSSCPWTLGPKRDVGQPSYRETTSRDVKSKIDRSFRFAHDMINSWAAPPLFNSPPAVLMRATETDSSRPASSESEDSVADGILGWSACTSLHLVRTIDLRGTHFTIFDADKLKETTVKIAEACALLEEYAQEARTNRVMKY